ncbi:MAG: galactose mutarotase [Verrucomicrobiae bacterium]|nr:galactose mutarotase [Verrucomicrobiae bacterium]MCP5532071.1 galactose mutarotase [Akkermansiaceae bacterium]MCP5543892.1 galactose mutarotase [Akkermansiaceae bacterium]MCP5547524.1 galactose mutarotase [Akkermansiaceae bacterium]
MKKPCLLISALAIALSACQKTGEMNSTDTGLKEEVYGKMPDGREVKIFTLKNKNGLRARVTEYGAILVSMEIPDKDGKLADVTHGYDTLEGWLGNTSYFGATVGRFGNRIANGKFSLNGKEYTLATNNDPGGIPCHLHGGEMGFDKVLWTGKAVGDNEVQFTYVSKDGEEGYPGALTSHVTYTLTDDNELIWKAKATTDAPTILNLVHHSYWNLSGDPTTSINDHILTLNAPSYLPTNAGLIPTGEIAPVEGTPMDFTEPTEIGKRVDADFEALKFGGGYDHCWVLPKGDGVQLAARLKDPQTGRVMEISTNQPAVQFYGGNFLDGTVAGKGGVKYAFRTALCLETENFPDAPNQPSFPSAVLNPGETYEHVMVHKFSAE